MEKLVLMFAALLVAGYGEKSTMEDPRIPEGIGGRPLKPASESPESASKSVKPSSNVSEPPVAESPLEELSLSEGRPSRSRPVVRPSWNRPSEPLKEVNEQHTRNPWSTGERNPMTPQPVGSFWPLGEKPISFQ